eukprot:365452-Chlamydomonas_euryale.AAC.13
MQILANYMKLGMGACSNSRNPEFIDTPKRNGDGHCQHAIWNRMVRQTCRQSCIPNILCPCYLIHNHFSCRISAPLSAAP